MPRTPDPEVGGSSPTRVKPCCVREHGTFTPQKVLVISRRRWLRPNMTDILFTGTIRFNQPTHPSFVIKKKGVMGYKIYLTTLLTSPIVFLLYLKTTRVINLAFSPLIEGLVIQVLR